MNRWFDANITYEEALAELNQSTAEAEGKAHREWLAATNVPRYLFQLRTGIHLGASLPMYCDDCYYDPCQCTIYTAPEKFGLKLIASMDFAGSYEFDITILLQDVKDGSLYWAKDSGCSCPEPFAGLTKENLTRVPSKEAFIKLIRRERAQDSYEKVSHFIEQCR